jgi:hypothetical protein
MSTSTQTAGPEKKPLWLPARIVDRLEQVAQVGDIEGGAASIVEVIMEGVLESFAAGDSDLLIGAWQFDDSEKVERELLDLSKRWQREDEKEVQS